MPQNEFNAAVVLRTDSAYTGEFRSSRDSSLVSADGHSRWHEQTSRGLVYTVTTAPAGVAIAAGNSAPIAAGSATVLTILNPLGSGVNLEILQGWVFCISGQPAAGFWSWCGAPADVSITATEAGALKRPCFVSQSVSRVKAWSGATITGAPVQPVVKPFPMVLPSGGNIDETVYDVTQVDNVDGMILVPPGCVISLAPAAVTTATYGAGIMYAEVPRLLRQAP